MRVIHFRARMQAGEIVLPFTKPETEWVRGRALAKMSPQRDHGRVQMRIATALDAWCGERGEVATEWRFRVAPPGEALRPLVPDVAFVRSERIRGLTHEQLQIPALAPDVAVEVLSDGDDPRDVADKIDVYLRAGTELVIVLDPAARTARLHDISGTAQLDVRATLRHPALPGFALGLRTFFASALDLRE